jgi:iron complex transport system permease protein
MSQLRPPIGLKVVRLGGYSLLWRPLACGVLGMMAIAVLAVLLFALSRGSLALPTSALLRGVLYPQALTPAEHYTLWDIRLPRLLMALLVGAMLGISGASMQSLTGNGLADPSLLGVKEGAGVVVLTQMLLFPAMGLLWRPVSGMLGGMLAALIVWLLARDLSRQRFILTGLGLSWMFAGVLGIFMTTADVRDVQTVLLWMTGSLNAVTWPLLLAAMGWALPALVVLLVTAKAADIALLGKSTALGLGVRLPLFTLLRFLAPVMLTATSVSCVGSIGFVGLMAPHLVRLFLVGGQLTLLFGSAMVGALLVLVADSCGRLLFAPLQLPAGIIIALLGGPFFLLLLWQRRDRF